MNDIQFRPDQLPFVNDSTSRFAVCLAGNGSGKSLCGAIKTVEFLSATPRRANSIFWIIGETVEEIGQAGWVEKLSLHLPKELIRQIHWHNAKRNYPKRIELWHPLVGGENSWVIEFLSHDQLANIPESAKRIGGFWIDEEIPFNLATKAVSCLEPTGHGWAAFTPAKHLCAGWYDAVMQVPDGWTFHQFCTVEHIEWQKQFLGSVPQSMRRTHSHGSFPAKAYVSQFAGKS